MQTAAARPKRLIAFDFDHTIVAHNSDTFIYRALPGGLLPASIKNQYVEGRWTAFMNLVLQHALQQGVGEQQLKEVLSQMELAPGMKELLVHLGSCAEEFDCLILSDANSMFIDTILAAHGLHNVFHEVLTNPAAFNAEGALKVQHHHSHDCPTCNVNLCKQLALKDFLARRQQQGVSYGQLLYVGDGRNDLCPCALLGPKDVVFPRAGYPLHALVVKEKQHAKDVLAQQQQHQQQQVQSSNGTTPVHAPPSTATAPDGQPAAVPHHVVVHARVVPWTSALQILECLKAECQELKSEVAH